MSFIHCPDRDPDRRAQLQRHGYFARRHGVRKRGRRLVWQAGHASRPL